LNLIGQVDAKMIKHNDGQILEDLDEADIILIGPSRTSKTQTLVYLAYNGFKTANIPKLQKKISLLLFILLKKNVTKV
jgi:regulator of PEP synthase PpsR (kinase-PPPase family)